MSLLNKADGYQALIRLTQALAKAEGEDADIIVDALNQTADLAESYLARACDTPDSAALKCATAVAEPPPAVPQRAADSGAHAPEPRMRAAPSPARGGP